MVLCILCQNRNGVHGCEEYDEFERQHFRLQCVSLPVFVFHFLLRMPEAFGYANPGTCWRKGPSGFAVL